MADKDNFEISSKGDLKMTKPIAQGLRERLKGQLMRDAGMIRINKDIEQLAIHGRNGIYITFDNPILQIEDRDDG